MQGYDLEIEADTIVCKEGDPSADLFFLKSGRLLICTISGTEVKAIARIEPGEFIGELSFFDGRPRASYVIATEKSHLIQIPKHELTRDLPRWYLEINKNLTKKIRRLDQVIQTSHLRRFGSQEQKPLTIDEQRKLYELLTQ